MSQSVSSAGRPLVSEVVTIFGENPSLRTLVSVLCDDEVIALQGHIETVSDDADLQEVYDTERQLPYVACTRARDHLLITSVELSSEFLDDLRR